MKLYRLGAVVVGCVAALALAACTTTFDSNKVDYKSQAKQAPSLEVPPDLTQITRDSRSSVPLGGATNASSFQGATQTSASGTSAQIASNSLGDVRVERDGSQRWLVVDRPADKIWDLVKTFWTEHGFVLVVDQPAIGILETDWAENRAKLPQDWFRKTFGGLMSGLYSTHERDKFRVRMERTASGGTEIYISHRGLVEEFTSSQKDNLKWKARSTDPELEVEFLKRLMVRLGSANQAAQQALVATDKAAVSVRAKIEQEGNLQHLAVMDSADVAWRRTGLSLDRTNFTVEDRDRSKGIYFVRYVQPENEKNAPGVLARMFGAKAPEALQKYQILLSAQGQQTRIRVANQLGQVIHTPDALHILKVLADDLK